MTEHDYLIAWAVYGVAALGCLWVSFKATGWMWRWLREPIRLIVALILFSPTIADPEHSFYAPSSAIVVMDLGFHIGNSAWRAVAEMALYGCIVFVAYLVFVLIRWLFQRSRRNDQAADQAPPPAGQPVPPATDNSPPSSPTPRLPERRTRIEPRL
jgi:predicted membrane protein